MTPNIPDDIDDLWEEIAEEAAAARGSQEAADLRQLNFEEAGVRKILTRYGLAGQAASLRREMRESTGKNVLLFSAFWQVHPSFPVQLYFRKLSYMHKVTQVDLFKRFSTTALWKAYEEAYSRSDGDRPVGLVFDWPTPETAEKVQGLGLMVLHNLPLSHDCLHTRFSRRFMTDPPQTVHIMRLSDLLDGLQWSPTG